MTTQQMLIPHEVDLLVAQVRQLAPQSCCPHDESPCLGCGLQWIVEQGIPISLSEDGNLQHAPAACA